MTNEEELSQRWMRGTRQGPEARPAHAHPKDVAVLVENVMAGPFKAEWVEKAVAAAYLHDILEDGRKEDGTPVTVEDLEAAGVHPTVISYVQTLTCREGQPKNEYLASLATAPVIAKIIKCCDRICNLDEGAPSFKDKRWARYVWETTTYILPLATSQPAYHVGKRLKTELARAAGQRPAGEYVPAV